MDVKGFPLVKDENGELFYGGSQDWYARKFARLAGCGPTCAANLAACYGIGVGPDLGFYEGAPVYSKNHFLNLMNQTYQYVKPGLSGFPWRDRFQDNFLAYASDRHAFFDTDFLESWMDTDTPYEFVRREIDAGRPLAMLILGHTEATIDDETWHWMAVTGCEPGKKQLIISTFGKRKMLDAELVFAPHEKNDVHLISFRKRN